MEYKKTYLLPTLLLVIRAGAILAAGCAGPGAGSARGIHPAVYPNVTYIIPPLPAAPHSLMTYTSTDPGAGTAAIPVPFQDPEFLNNQYTVPYKEFSLITPERAVEELKTHRLSVDETFLWHNHIGTSDRIEISGISLNYLPRISPSGVRCYQPVYTFSGMVRNGTVQSAGFVEHVPATEYLVEYDFL